MPSHRAAGYVALHAPPIHAVVLVAIALSEASGSRSQEKEEWRTACQGLAHIDNITPATQDGSPGRGGESRGDDERFQPPPPETLEKPAGLGRFLY